MYLTHRFYMVLAAIAIVLGLGYAFPWLFTVGRVLVALLALITVADMVLLYYKRGVTAERVCSDRFSNGDDNVVTIHIQSSYPFPTRMTVIDEAPHIFQRRDVEFFAKCSGASRNINHHPISVNLTYTLRPTRRGVYGFGRIRVFVRTPLGMVERRYTQGEAKDVRVYPSYLMLRQYELLAMSNNLTELGIKKIRRAGNNTEFEQIKDYVVGDEYRAINWKASARRAQLMVNVYQDERSQQIFSVIDKGRVMQQAFRGMTLLDYAINASLVLSYIAIRKDDKAGLITFSHERASRARNSHERASGTRNSHGRMSGARTHSDFDSFVPPSKQPGHMQVLMEELYAQETVFGETDFHGLCVGVNKHVGKRSLLILYTNFSDMTSMRRQLAYLQLLNRRHRLLVVFFKDVELQEYIASQPERNEDYYQHVIAEKFDFEKRLIVSTLKQNGIYSLLTTPDQLSVAVINKYLEMKTRQLI